MQRSGPSTGTYSCASKGKSCAICMAMRLALLYIRNACSGRDPKYLFSGLGLLAARGSRNTSRPSALTPGRGAHSQALKVGAGCGAAPQGFRDEPRGAVCGRQTRSLLPKTSPGDFLSHRYPPVKVGKAGQSPPNSPMVERLGLWSWMLPPPEPGPPNV